MQIHLMIFFILTEFLVVIRRYYRYLNKVTVRSSTVKYLSWRCFDCNLHESGVFIEYRILGTRTPKSKGFTGINSWDGLCDIVNLLQLNSEQWNSKHHRDSIK